YDGDPNSADSRHYGRLAGFTNQKPQHAKDGRQPYVLAHDCPGKPAERAQALLETVGQGLARAEAEKARSARLEALEGYKSPGHGWHSDPGHEYQRQAKRLIERYGKTADFSRLDWMIATDMAKSGRFSADGIAGAIEKHSPEVATRKAGHVEDYAKRTAEKAWNAPEVAAERQQQAEQARQAKRDRGPSLGR
ncbi:DNA-primase RepB domain-containing protein, partial [Serratia marcescens]|uniref:DNA-primase RepB domain-containing protein n=1 Tax=Serratia marcescens TaxID=615 RepID=UPI001F150522